MANFRFLANFRFFTLQTWSRFKNYIWVMKFMLPFDVMPQSSTQNNMLVNKPEFRLSDEF